MNETPVTYLKPSPEPKAATQRTADQHALSDEQVWLSMWCAAVNADDPKQAPFASRIADTGLEHFQRRFRTPTTGQSS